jgi:hypothetical protein
MGQKNSKFGITVVNLNRRFVFVPTEMQQVCALA